MNPSQKEEIEYEDGSNFRGYDDTNPIQLALSIYRKAVDEGSKEMSGGGVLRRVIDGNVEEVPIPNQKQIFCNAARLAHSHFKSLLQKSRNDLIKKKFLDLEEEQKRIETERKRLAEERKKIESDVLKIGIARTYPQQLHHEGRIRQFNTTIQEAADYIEGLKVEHSYSICEAISFLLEDLGYLSEKGGSV